MEAEERTRLDADPVSDLASTGTANAQHDPESNKSTSTVDEHDYGTEHLSENGMKRKRTPPPEGMSRSAYKKLKRNQQWEAGRADRRAKRKDKEREKRQARKAAIAAGEALAPASKQPKEPSTCVPVTFVIDCGFDELMTENEIKSLASQITRCYSDNSRAKYRAHLAVCSFNGRLRQRFDTILEQQYKVWRGATFYDEDFVDVSMKAKEKMLNRKTGGVIDGALARRDDVGEASPERGEVIYLSSESEHTIEHLSPYSTYIIGGLVDRNRHKGICYKRARERGIKTAKLPIGEFMEMNSRYVLATNHVNEIMLQWLDNGDWGDAFVKVMPKRKGGTLKTGRDSDLRPQVEDDEHIRTDEERHDGEAEEEAEGVGIGTDEVDGKQTEH